MVVLVDKKAHWLGALSALPEDPSFVPRTHTEWPTAAWKFSSGGNLPFSSWASVHMWLTHTDTNTFQNGFMNHSLGFCLFVFWLIGPEESYSAILRIAEEELEKLILS